MALLLTYTIPHASIQASIQTPEDPTKPPNHYVPTAAQKPVGHMLEAIPHFFCAICASGMHVMRGHRPGGHSRAWFGATCRSPTPDDPWWWVGWSWEDSVVVGRYARGDDHEGLGTGQWLAIPLNC